MNRCIITVLNNDGSIVSVELKGDCIIHHDKEYDTWRCTKLEKNIEEIEDNSKQSEEKAE